MTLSPSVLLRLPQALARIPISRSGWYAGIQTGKYPAPIKIGPRTAAWRQSDIDLLIDTLSN